MPQKDYYQILGVSSPSTEDEIKRAYRKLALETHPDRNHGSPEAAERFKDISEAYGVLSDPEKKKEYDRYRQFGSFGESRASGAGFGYSQEEILRDLFKSRYAQDLFTELQKEFQRKGFRFDESFIKSKSLPLELFL